jgi:hypothetical protein
MSLLAEVRNTSLIDGDQWEDEEMEENFVDEDVTFARGITGYLPNEAIEEILPRQIRESNRQTDISRESVAGIGDMYENKIEDEAELFQDIEEGYVQEIREVESPVEEEETSQENLSLEEITPIDFPQSSSRELTLYNFIYQSIENYKMIQSTEVITNHLFCKLYYGVTYSDETEKVLTNIVNETGLRSYFV